MSDEEKDLLESDLGELDDLADFVDLSDLGDLENADNMDIFGSLGDLTDLGDIPDLSATMELSDSGDADISDMALAAADDDIPDLSDMDLAAADDDIPDFSDMDLPNTDDDIPDLSDMDLPNADDDIPDLSDMDLPNIDDDIPDFSDMDLPNADDDISDLSDIDLLDAADDDSPMDIPDIGFLDDVASDDDISELSDIDLSDSLDMTASFDTPDEDITDILGTSDSSDSDMTEDFADIGMSNLGEIDGIPVLSDFDVAEAEQNDLSDMSMAAGLDTGGDLLGLDEATESFEDLGLSAEDGIGSMEEPIMSDGMTDSNSEFSITEDGLLGDMDINFDDMTSVEPEPVAASESGSSGGSNIDSMLDGLLDNLDMTGSLDGGRKEVEETATSADMLGLDGDSYEDLGSGESMEMLDASMLPPEEEEKEKKPGFFKKIFGNVVTDEIAEEERKAAEQEAEEAEKKAEEAQKAAEEKAALKEQKKAEKEAKAAAKKKEKEELKAQKAAEKAEKKAQAEAEAAEIEVVGKLNKVGVSIVIVCTILFLVFEIGGTNLFNYSRVKKEATNYFKMGKYTDAYKSAIGTDMKDKDSEEYDKIRTVMRVQQAINAYQNYARVKYYPEALDALLRGLKRYDANIDHATELEVDKDMMKCRRQIISILQTEFQMSETDAYSIIGMEKPQYQDKVIAIGVKKAQS